MLDVSRDETTFNFLEYCELAKSKTMRLRTKARSAGPFPPTHYTILEDRETKETICFLWLDQARQKWIVVEDVDGELEDLFA